MSSKKPVSKKYLTKSRFKLALECPAKLMYTGRDEYVDAKQSDEMLQGLAEGGFQIGALAQVIYAQEAIREGVHWEEVKGNQQEQIQQTNDLLQRENITLLEPTIQTEDFLVRVDVLRKRGDQIDLIEVKSKSFDSLKNNPLGTTKFIPYLQDVAFQTMVLRKDHPDWNIHSYLMMSDKSKVTTSAALHRLFPVQFKGVGKDRRAFVDITNLDQLPQIDHRFMVALNVDHQVKKILNSPPKTIAPTGSVDEFETLATQWANLYVNRLEIDPPISSSNCSKCEFYTDSPTAIERSGFHECWQKKIKGFQFSSTRDETVLRLYDDKKRIKKNSMERGSYFLKEIKREDLGWTPIDGPLTNPQRQWMQISGEWPGDGDFYFDKAGFLAERETWCYPYYFLDFEGARCALPFRPGQRPNAMNAFQYSLHVMYEDGRVEHKDEFFDLSQDGDPHSRLLRALKKSLGDKGTVFRWHDYENTLLNELRDELLARKNPEPDRDELVAFIETLTHKKDKNGHYLRIGGGRDMVDQCKLAAKYYFHPSTRGSSSIKKVLPAIMGSSTFLKETYSQPIYGASGTMSSLNYTDRAVIWWQEDPYVPGATIDPYKLLPDMINSTAGNNLKLEILEEGEKKLGGEDSAVQNGGAAMMGYIRYQSGMIQGKEERDMKTAMLCYCELDTLAMVMVMQGFFDFTGGI